MYLVCTVRVKIHTQLVLSFKNNFVMMNMLAKNEDESIQEIFRALYWKDRLDICSLSKKV